MSGLRQRAELVLFYQTAKRYCALVEGELDGDREAWMRKVAVMLAKLVGMGFELVKVPYEDGVELPKELDPVHEDWARMVGRLGNYLGEVFYREFFDPRKLDENEEEVFGSLADDLADVWRDLVVGVRAWELGEEQYVGRILYEWVFGFQYHWGEHATGALRYLYWRVGKAC